MSVNLRNLLFIILFLLLLIAAAWLIHDYYGRQVTRNVVPTVAPVTSSTPVIGKRTKDSNCIVQGPLPDKQCTPGAIFEQATVSEICVSGYTKTVRNVPQKLKRAVYAAYGVKHRLKGEYEMDHLIPLELGGSNDIANLFPEAAEPRPGFHEKDKVENYLHREVCAGRMNLRAAQNVIANDWLSVYKQLN